MSQEQLTIFTEQLRDDHHEKIDLIVSPGFLDLNEQEAKTSSPVSLQGKAYLLDDILMIQLAVSTTIEIPCCICNLPTQVPLENRDILLSISTENIPSTVFDYAPLVREEIVMLIPQFVECHQRCPHRKTLEPYLKQPDSVQSFPFKGL